MKTYIIPSILTLFAINAYAQITFEKGYFINPKNEKITCLIKNIVWKNNPSKIEYKLNESDEVRVAAVNEILEFGIDGFSKYISRTVAIDRSSNNTDKLSSQRAPKFKQEDLFLKTLIEGDASLYMYEDGELRCYFYTTSTKNIEQLVFKFYRTNANKIGFNTQYKQQLLNNLNCSKITMKQVENLNYQKKDLITFFSLYNDCQGKQFVNYEETEKRKNISLTIRPGIYNSKVYVSNTNFSSRNVNFDSEVGFRVGVEVGFILPFNKNKWEVFIEPTYRIFKAEKEIPSHNVTANLNSIELPFGVRHHMFLNDGSDFFVNGAFVLEYGQNANIEYSNAAGIEIGRSYSTAFGIGYKHHETYSLELRYQMNKGLFGDYLLWNSDNNSISIIFGYSIF